MGSRGEGRGVLVGGYADSSSSNIELVALKPRPAAMKERFIQAVFGTDVSETGPRGTAKNFTPG